MTNQETTDHLVSLREACQRLGGISRPTLYKILSAGEIGSVEIGRRRMIPTSDIRAYIDRHSTKRAS